MPTINLATLRVKLTADNAEYQKKSLSRKQKTQEHSKVFETAIAGAAVAAFAVAAKAAIDFAKESSREFQQFDKQIREVYTLMPGMSTKAMDAASGDVWPLAQKVGRVSDEVVPALYQAISAGVPQDNAFEFMRVASDAAAGGVLTETAVDGISSVSERLRAGRHQRDAGQRLDVHGREGLEDDLHRDEVEPLALPSSQRLHRSTWNLATSRPALATMHRPGHADNGGYSPNCASFWSNSARTAAKAADTFEKLAGKSRSPSSSPRAAIWPGAGHHGTRRRGR